MLLNMIGVIMTAAFLSGIGWLVMKMVRLDHFFHDLNTSAFWLGWAAVIAALQVWHFFLPVNLPILLILMIGSLAGWYFFFRQAKPRQMLTTGNLLFAAFMLLPLIILCNHVLFSEPSYDHGLYHFQTVKWFNQFPLVRGLGNLHHRLAFNSTNMLYAALLNVGPLQGFGFYLANTTLIFMLLVRLCASLLSWLKQPLGENRHALFDGLMLPVVLWQASVYPLAGYSADMAIFALQVVLAGEFLRLLAHKSDEPVSKHKALLMAVLVAVGVTVKLSSAVFGAALMLMVLVAWFRSRSQADRRADRAPFLWAGLLALWVLPWLIRNVLLSGYLLYPSALFALPVAWKMPSFLINDLSSGISLWARTYSGQIAYTGDLSWFVTWLVRFVYEPRLAFILGVVFLVILALVWLRAGKKIQISTAYIMLVIVSALSLLFWFISGPTYRFSGAAFWIFCFSAALGLFQFIHLRWGEMVAARTAVIFLFFLFFNLRPEFSRNISPGRLLFPLNERVIAEQQQPISGLTSKTTLSGLIVNLPPETSPETCWDLPLPCTTRNDFVERLQLMDAADMRGGFYIPGAQ